MKSPNDLTCFKGLRQGDPDSHKPESSPCPNDLTCFKGLRPNQPALNQHRVATSPNVLTCFGEFGQELDARTFYPSASHEYVLAMQGRRTCILTCFKGVVSDFGFRAKITNASFAKQNSQETGARRRPWRQRESFGLVLRWGFT